jgi:lysozyme family protein
MSKSTSGGGTEVFEKSLEFVRLAEGGYSDDPKDHGNWTGGAPQLGVLKGTKYGISAASYPNLDIKGLTWADAKEIYHEDYWLPSGADAFSPATGLLLFDAAVQHGVKASTRILQRAVGVDQDGFIGPFTMRAADSVSPSELFYRLLFFRSAVYMRIPQPEFMRGWANRMEKLEAFSREEMSQ